MNGCEQEVVAQPMISLPFLSNEVPTLYLADGRPYITVFAVCHALGIRPDIHLWRSSPPWVTERKFSLQTERRGKRQVWCLLIS
jgi:hypothetical protein